MRLALPLALLLVTLSAAAADWPQFRGPNASGVSSDTGLPVRFGPTENVVWKTPLPPGYSSPVIAGDRIFITAFENGKLLTFCLDRASGRVLWRREFPRPRTQEHHKENHPASPSPVTDGSNVYVFFADFGLLSYGPDGNERWRRPLGPFNNPFGMAASPVLAGDKILQVCDQEESSFFVAVDTKTGTVRWRVERPDVTRAFSTPVLYKPPDGPLQAIITGSYRLTGYSVDSGQELWLVRGLTWQMKATPVVAGDRIYVSGWAGGADTGQQELIPPFEDVLKQWDADGDGRLSKTEILDDRITKDWRAMDLDDDGYLRDRDWRFYRSRRSAQNGVIGIRLGGRGDITDSATLWRYAKSLPNVPSPLFYKGALYLMKEGGLLTTLDPATGAVMKQARLEGALGRYFASPVAADDKVYTISEEGVVTVLKAGAQWEVLASNNLDDEVRATPAIVGGRLYLRTRGALYCFAKRDSATSP